VSPCAPHPHYLQIYLSDYADTSLYELRAWLANTSTFDWHAVVRSVAVNEGCTDDVTIIERQARARVRGIWHCDVHKETVCVLWQLFS
jgi:hypothetical protein